MLWEHLFLMNTIQTILFHFFTMNSTMNLKHSITDQFKIASFAALSVQSSLLFSTLHQINQKKCLSNPLLYKLQFFHFPYEKTKSFLVKTDDIDFFFTDILRTQTLLTIRRYFFLIEKLSRVLKIRAQ